MPIQLTELIMERLSCPIHYWTGGPAGRPLVVLTHGACVDHRSFDAVLPVVAEQYRVLTWDVRGHGLSQPAGQPLTVPLAVDDLLALLDRLGQQQAIFVGHSNGTYIAQELAFRHPERVRALVIADGTCITWVRPKLDYFMVKYGIAMMNLFPFETLKKSSLPSNAITKAAQDYIYDAFSMLSKRDFIGIMQGISACLHPEPGYQITQPLLLMHGDQDRMGDIVKITPKWAAREPNCQYEVISNAGHFAVIDNSKAFTRLLMEFLHHWAPV